MEAANHADSAGQPWTGRSFDAHPNTFAGDDGAAPADLVEALERFHALAGAREAAGPGAVARESAVAESAGPDAVARETVVGEAAGPDAVARETVVGESAGPDAVARETAGPDGVASDAADPWAADANRELAAAQLAVIEAVREARLLVPLLAHAGETGVDEHGRMVDKTQELSIVTVQAPDGRTALPAFTSTEAMARWNAKARPIPTPARRVALAAAGEGTDLLIIDPTSPTEFAIRRPALWAIAQGLPWLPPLADTTVQAAFAASITGEPAIEALILRQGDPADRLTATEVVVELALRPGLDRGQLDALLGRLQKRWAESEPIAGGVDSLSVTLRQAPAR